MKTLIMALAAAIVVAAPAAYAEKKGEGAKPRQERRPPPPEEGMRHGAGPWVAYMLSAGDNLEKIGIEDANLCEKLRVGLKAQRKKSVDLEKKIREVSREQAMMMRNFLGNKGCTAQDIYAKIDEVSSLRAQQGKIAVETMAILRDNLNDKQLKAAMKFIKNGAMMRGGREGGPGGERFRRGGRDGEGPRPMMRDGEGPRHGMRDGKGPKRRMRDGEGSRPAMRDGDGPKPAMCDGEGRPKKMKKDEGKPPRKGMAPAKKRRPPVENGDNMDDQN